MKKKLFIAAVIASLATAFAGASATAENEPPLPWSPAHVAEIIPINPDVSANLA